MYEIKTRVMMADCSPDGFQSPVSMITMLQNCSALWEESEPALVKWEKENGITQVIASRQMDILRRPAYREELSVRTSIYQVKGTLGYRNTVIYDAEDKPVCASWGIGTFISLADGKMNKFPPEVMEPFCIDEKFDMEYLPKRIHIPEAEAIVAPDIIASRSMIDMNKHVNNAEYVRMAYDLLPDSFQVKRMRIEYKSQARPGATITPRIYVGPEGNVVVCLLNEESNPYCILEFC